VRVDFPNNVKHIKLPYRMNRGRLFTIVKFFSQQQWQGKIEEKRKLAMGHKVIKQMVVLYFLPTRKAG
jgi:hypothetical protein